MARLIRHCFWVLVMAFIAVNTQAQTLPVSSQLQLTPPYSVYFSDLLRPETDQVKLNLLLRDLQEPFVDVKLRLRVEGPGISLETAPWYNAPAITLESGIPQLLTSVELAPYFDAANLNFGGISRSKYEQQGSRLPEGLYRISFTVFDAMTDRQLSQPGQAIAWMALSEPPRLNLPFCDTEINLENGQQYIVFQWSPVGVSPNTYGELEYEFTLTEIRPEGRDPYEAMRTLPPIYQFTTSETSLVYDNDEPLLIPGMSYAWRIQAKDVNGKERFREQGFSPVCMFRVAEVALPTASGVRAEAISSFQGRGYWDLNQEVEDYRVEYRSVDGSSGTWYGINEPEQPGGAIDGEVNLTGLIPGKEYEVRVGSRRDGLVSSWSESVYFTTPEEEVMACGDVPPSVPLEEFEPLENASVGDVIAAGNVDLTLVSFTGSNGVFSGWGTVKIKFLGNRIPVEFQDIKINKNYQMVEGTVRSVQSNIDDYIRQWRETQDDTTDSTGSDGTGSQDGTNTSGGNIDYVDYDGEIDSVYVDPDTGLIVVVDEDGETETYEQEEGSDGTTITDNSGDSWTVDSQGNVTQGTSGEGQVPDPVNSLDSIDYIVRFEPAPDQSYGFDRKDGSVGDYERTTIRGQEYWVPWKSVETGRQDKVAASTDNEAFPESVGFKTMTGEQASQPGTDAKQKQVQVAGNMAGHTDQLTAYVRVQGSDSQEEQEVEVGKLNVVTYDKVRKQVFIVPVNGVSAQNVATEINEIYAQAVSEWDVTVDNPFTVDESIIKNLDAGESGLLASFPENMREFRRQFKRSRSIDRDAYYIFLVKGSNTSRKGFMPFKRQFGFIFTDKLGGTSLANAIAHELGHGAFRLRHPQSEYGVVMDDNLMHNTNGKKLRKFQWDNVHDPESALSWFIDDEEAGMANSFDGNGLFKLLNSSVYNFGPGITLKYKIENWQNIKTYFPELPSEIANYQVLLLVERGNKIVYSYSKDLEASGSVGWHGYVFADDVEMTSSNYTEYKLHLGIAYRNSIDETYKHWTYYQGSRPTSTVLKSIDGNVNLTFIDLIPNIKFGVNEAWDEWKKMSNEARDLVGGRYSSYETFKEELGKTGNGVGDFLNSLDNPLDYLNDNMIEIEFLNSKFKVFKSFAPKLEYVKEKLGEARMKEIAHSCKYTLGMGIRFKKGGNGISMHSFGTVVDIYPKANLFLKPYRSGIGEKEMIIFVNQVTGLDLSDRTARTPVTITEAQTKFLDEFSNGNMTFERLVSLYDRIDTYNGSKKSYLIEALEGNTIYNELFDMNISIDLGILGDIPVFLDKIKILNSLLNTVTGKYTPLESVVFSEEGRQELNALKNKVQELYTSLSPLYGFESNESLVKEVFATIDINKYRDIAVNQWLREYKQLFDKLSTDYNGSFKGFALEFKKWNDAPDNTNFGNKLFEDGFCNVPLDLIEAFREQSDITWGGMDWNGSNIDYMHFEINESKTVNYLKNP